MISNNYVLIIGFIYNLIIILLRIKPRINKRLVISKFVIKSILRTLIFFLGIFLLDRIDFPTPTKAIKQEISNDKLITLK